MRLLLAVILAALIPNLAHAESLSQRIAGGIMETDTATTDALNFGFQSTGVTVCYRAGAAAATNVAYLRLGTSNTATSSALFIEAAGGSSPPGRAVPLTGGDDGTNQNCVTLNVRTPGLVLHTAVQGEATLDVLAW